MKIIALFMLLATVGVNAQTTAFTYQGQLNQAGQAASGDYDFQFLLFDTDDFLQSNEFAGPVNLLGQPVTAGNFSAELDFGPGIFGTQDLWLEIRVRESGVAGPFTTLAPRQKVNAVPLALVATEAQIASLALSASQADIANAVAPGSIGATEIDSNAVQQRITGLCPLGSSIRSIDSTGNVSCETDNAGDNVGLSTQFSVSEVRNNGRTVSSKIGTPLNSSACFLTRVWIRDTDSSSETAGCRVSSNESRWVLEAFAMDDSEADCSMRCVTGI